MYYVLLLILAFNSGDLGDLMILAIHLFRIVVHVVEVVVGRACNSFVIDESVGLFEVSLAP